MHLLQNYLRQLRLNPKESMKILLVEDEELYANQVEILVDRIGHQLIGVCDSSDKVINVLDHDEPDLILMDVHINGEYDGIELASLINKDQEIPIIFITSLRDDLTFKRAQRVGATNFIVKPFDQLQLERAIDLAVKKPKSEPKDNDISNIGSNHFYIKQSGTLTKVGFDEIYYLSADGHYCNVHKANKKFIVRISLVQLADKIPKNFFLQTHRSYIINKKKIKKLNLKENIIDLNGQMIPISKLNRAEVIKSLGLVLE